MIHDQTDSDNNKQLTPEKLKSYKGLEHLTDTLTTNAIHTIEQLSILLFENPPHVPAN